MNFIVYCEDERGVLLRVPIRKRGRLDCTSKEVQSIVMFGQLDFVHADLTEDRRSASRNWDIMFITFIYEGVFKM